MILPAPFSSSTTNCARGKSLQRVLAEEFDVLCARNAQEAEAMLAGDLVQVILCDQRMPGETGVDFLRRVRDLWPDPVRMIISGFSESEDIIAGVNEAGIYQYITKPWHPEKLLECVRDAVKLYRLQKEPGGGGADAKPSHETLNRVLTDRRREQRRMFEFDRIVHEPGGPMVETLALARKADAIRHFRADHRRVRAPARNCWPAPSISAPRAATSLSSSKIAARCRTNCWKANCSAARRAPTPAPIRTASACSNSPTAARSFSTKSARPRPPFRSSCCACCRSAKSARSARTRPRKVDVRVISATNRDLEIEVERGAVPPRPLLSPQRLSHPSAGARPSGRGDIPLDRRAAFSTRSIAPSAARFRASRPRRCSGCAPIDWPGNVRELHNEIQRMVAMSDDDEPLGPHLLRRGSRAARDGRRRAGTGDGA